MKLGGLLKWGVFHKRDCFGKGGWGSLAERLFYNSYGKLTITKI
jgi:hypothetical protein